MVDQNLESLTNILQLAYSGELAAAYAYRGHWKSISNSDEHLSIRKIEEDEWHHRNLVGEMLRTIGRRPSYFREARAFLIGRMLGILCHFSGWFLPMYAAGKLESRNIKEYESAARFAAASGHYEFVDCLLTMAEVEWDHEHYFRACVLREPKDPPLAKPASSRNNSPCFSTHHRGRKDTQKSNTIFLIIFVSLW